MIVDAHTHWIPHSLLDCLARNGLGGVTADEQAGAFVVTFPGCRPLRPVAGVMIDTADRTTWLTVQGVGHQIVAPWLDLQGQDLPGAAGASWTRFLNDSMAESATASPQSVSVHASVHLADPHAAAEELGRAVTELGMRSVMIPATLPEGRLADPGYDELWAAAVGHAVPVILHGTTSSPAGELLAHYPALHGLFGRHIETTLTAAELIVTGALDRFPDLRLLVVHGGGFLPYQAVRFDRDARLHKSGSGLPSDILRSLYYDSTTLSAPSLRLLYELAGFERVVVGTDYGATPAWPDEVSVAGPVIRSSPQPEVTDAVLHGNARDLFGLGGFLDGSREGAGLD